MALQPDYRDILAAFVAHAVEYLVVGGLWMGVPPVRIDLLKGVPGGDFDRSYQSRVVADWDGIQVSIVNRTDLIALKRASARPQDLLDADALERA